MICIYIYIYILHHQNPPKKHIPHLLQHKGIVSELSYRVLIHQSRHCIFYLSISFHYALQPTPSGCNINRVFLHIITCVIKPTLQGCPWITLDFHFDDHDVIICRSMDPLWNPPWHQIEPHASHCLLFFAIYRPYKGSPLFFIVVFWSPTHSFQCLARCCHFVSCPHSTHQPCSHAWPLAFASALPPYYNPSHPFRETTMISGFPLPDTLPLPLALRRSVPSTSK